MRKFLVLCCLVGCGSPSEKPCPEMCEAAVVDPCKCSCVVCDPLKYPCPCKANCDKCTCVCCTKEVK